MEVQRKKAQVDCKRAPQKSPADTRELQVLQKRAQLEDAVKTSAAGISQVSEAYILFIF